MTRTRLLLLAGLAGVASTFGFRAPLPSAWSGAGDARGEEIPFEVAKIYWEYNDSDGDLGVHVFLDGEDWRDLKIVNPDGRTIFAVSGFGPYRHLGMTELFFEGAEPSLAEVPLQELLDLFPEGDYEFEGRTVDREKIEGEAAFSHAIPDGPEVTLTTGPGNLLRLDWTAVTSPPPGFPDLPIQVVAYQVIIDDFFQVTVPASVLSLTVSPEFVGSLAPGEHEYEVLAIEASGNQSITEEDFVL